MKTKNPAVIQPGFFISKHVIAPNHRGWKPLPQIWFLRVGAAFQLREVDHNNSYCVQPRYKAAGFHINLNIKKVFNNRIEDSRKGIHEKKPKVVSKLQVTFKGKT